MTKQSESIAVDFTDPTQVAAIVQRLFDETGKLHVEVAALTRVISCMALVDDAPGEHAAGAARLRVIAEHALREFPKSEVLAALASTSYLAPPGPHLRVVRNDETPDGDGGR